jgi:hypothetical protein
MTSRAWILVVVGVPAAVAAQPMKKQWACDTIAKMSTCFEVEDDELARKSDTAKTGREMLEAVCEAGGGKLETGATGICTSDKVVGSCFKMMALPKSFYPKGAPDHYTWAAHYYASGDHPTDASDAQRCKHDGGLWFDYFVPLQKPPSPSSPKR